jgi:hypothetical protein
VATFVHPLIDRPIVALTAAVGTVGDPEGTRTVTSLIALLVALGLGLVMLAVWLHRSTRPDPELLAPLEAMGDRKWRRADPVWQRRHLDALRPAGALPLEPSVAPPAVDEAFDRGPLATGFDDLHHDPDPLVDDDESGAAAQLETPKALERPLPGDLPTDGDDDDDDVDVDIDADADADADADRETAIAEFGTRPGAGSE